MLSPDMNSVNLNKFEIIPSISKLNDIQKSKKTKQQNLKVANIFGDSFNQDVYVLNDKNGVIVDEEKFKNWRQEGVPEITQGDPLVVDLEYVKKETMDELKIQEVENTCLQEYGRANEALNKTIGDVAINYVYKNGDPKTKEKGPLLEFSNAVSSRWLDIFRSLVKYEMSKGLPMISNAAGQMKNYGFSTKEIIDMKKDCQNAIEIVDNIKNELLKIKEYQEERKNNPQLNSVGIEAYNKMLGILFVNDNRENFKKELLQGNLSENVINKLLQVAIESYEKNVNKNQIDRAFFKISSFNGLEFDKIIMQLSEVANLKLNKEAKEDERLLMELRHRVGGEGSVQQRAPGSLGQNPLAYLNLIRKGEQTNFPAEFRGQMYFVYKSFYLGNTVMLDPEFIKYTNQMLKNEKKGWEIDLNLVDALNKRAGMPPPVFRYGPQANLNKYLRKMYSAEEKGKYFEKHPNPTLEEAMSGKAHPDANFRFFLTERELLSQFGDMKLKDIDAKQVLSFIPGASLFQLASLKDLSEDKVSEKDRQDPKYKLAREYIQIVEKLKLPVAAGVSGTMDAGITSAGLVGLGIGNDKKEEQELTRLAYIAFMVPTSDHSTHEILQSSKTFGLEYTPGADFINQIYPKAAQQFVEQITQRQHEKNEKMPTEYLSKEHAREVFDKLRQKN
jgi:hypothetical protein